jgi:hypothetical protein
MSTNDLKEILDSRLRLTPFKICAEARSEIVALSCGLPYYIQTLGGFATHNAMYNQRLQIQLDDVNAAIDNFISEYEPSFADDYRRAVESRSASNTFCENILACALTLSGASGVFSAAEVAKTLNTMAPEKGYYPTRVQQYLAQFTLDRRGKILIRSGLKPDYRYRFADALMQPFIVMRAIKDAMIDENLRHLLFHSDKEQDHDAGRRLGPTAAGAMPPGTIIPTVTEKAGEEPILSESRLARSRLGLHPGNASAVDAPPDSSRTATVVRRAQERSWRLFRR